MLPRALFEVDIEVWAARMYSAAAKAQSESVISVAPAAFPSAMGCPAAALASAAAVAWIDSVPETCAAVDFVYSVDLEMVAAAAWWISATASHALNDVADLCLSCWPVIP